MKKAAIILALAVGAALASGMALADQYVRGYLRSDGTYVRGYYRSNPNQYRWDNYSSRGNINPYTGESGSERNEFTSPPEYNRGRGAYRGYYGYGW